MDQQTFDALYRAAQDPRVLALQDLKTADGLPDVGARTKAALVLHDAKLIINEGIDINGMDPFFFMRWLSSMGMVWHEALFQAAPGSLLDYLSPAKAWPGSIKISLDPADYPAFTQPVAPVDHTLPVGGAGGLPGTFSINPLVFYKNGVPQYGEGASATAPNGESVTAHYGPSGIMWGWSWETSAAKATRIQSGN